MKKTRALTLVAAAAAVAATTLLVGCGGGSSATTTTGGGSGTATVGGSISGVPSGVTVLLVNNGKDIISANASGNFTFDAKVKAGAAYNVALFSQPPGAYCTLANASGTVDQNADTVSNLSVVCQSAPVAGLPYNIGVTVSGLSAGNSVTFAVNSADPLTVNTNGLAVFSQTFNADEAPGQGATGVTIATQPSNQTCALTHPAPATGPADFVNFTAVCQ